MQALMSTTLASTNSFLEKHRVMETITSSSTAIQAELNRVLDDGTRVDSSSQPALRRTSTFETVEQGGKQIEHEEISRTEERELQRQRALWQLKAAHSANVPGSFSSKSNCSSYQTQHLELSTQLYKSKVQSACEHYYCDKAAAKEAPQENPTSRWGAPLQNHFLRPTMMRRDSGLFGEESTKHEARAADSA